MDNREIGARIRLARRDAGLTQEKLAEKIGVSTVFVSQLESGSRAPGLETLVKLSQTLHVSLDLLVLGGAPGGDAEACLAALVQGRSPRQRMLAGQPGAKPVCRDGPFGCRAAGMLTHAFFEKGGRARPGERVKRCVERISGRETALCGPADIRKNSPGNKMLFRRAVFFIQYYFRGKRAAFCHRFCRSVCSSRRATSVSPARWPRPAAPFRVWAGPCPAPSQ